MEEAKRAGAVWSRNSSQRKPHWYHNNHNNRSVGISILSRHEILIKLSLLVFKLLPHLLPAKLFPLFLIDEKACKVLALEPFLTVTSRFTDYAFVSGQLRRAWMFWLCTRCMIGSRKRLTAVLLLATFSDRQNDDSPCLCQITRLISFMGYKTTTYHKSRLLNSRNFYVGPSGECARSSNERSEARVGKIHLSTLPGFRAV